MPTFQNRSHSTQRGFTLIEIMIVVVILSILASFIIPRIMNRPDQARVVKAQQDMRTALMEYEMKYYDRILELDDNETYTAAVAKLDEKLAEGTLVDAKYAEAKQALLREFAGLDPQSYIANINGQQFTAAV